MTKLSMFTILYVSICIIATHFELGAKATSLSEGVASNRVKRGAYRQNPVDLLQLIKDYVDINLEQDIAIEIFLKMLIDWMSHYAGNGTGSQSSKIKDQFERLTAEAERTRQGEIERRRKVDAEPRRQGEDKSRRQGEIERRRKVDAEPRRQGEDKSRRQGEIERRRKVEAEPRRQGEDKRKRQGEIERRQKEDAERRRQGQDKSRRHGDAERERQKKPEVKNCEIEKIRHNKRKNIVGKPHWYPDCEADGVRFKTRQQQWANGRMVYKCVDPKTGYDTGVEKEDPSLICV